MIILLSPAKTIDMTPVGRPLKTTLPRCGKEASFLAGVMRDYDKGELARLMKVNPQIAARTCREFRNFGPAGASGVPAAFAYTGSVYRHLGAATLTDSELAYMQRHLRIISTMYGVLRPLDEIRPYRLSFRMRPEGMEGNLYNFWKEKITNMMIADIGSPGKLLVNLASKEISDSMDIKMLRAEGIRVVTAEFKDWHGHRFETIRTYTKMAREAMARFLVRNMSEDPKVMKAFDWEGYTWDEESSTADNYVFLRG